MTRSSLGITFTLIPMPSRKVVEDFGLKYDFYRRVFATIIIDKKGIIRFKSQEKMDSLTSTSTIIKELQGIQ